MPQEFLEICEAVVELIHDNEMEMLSTPELDANATVARFCAMVAEFKAGPVAVAA